jgi:hypothetical protein
MAVLLHHVSILPPLRLPVNGSFDIYSSARQLPQEAALTILWFAHSIPAEGAYCIRSCRPGVVRRE